MLLTFKSKYKSLNNFDAIELPDFTVVTGANGSGKTHLLEAIVNGNISIQGIATSEIKYFNLSNFGIADNNVVQPKDYETARNNNCQSIAKIANAFKEQIEGIIIQSRQSFPNFGTFELYSFGMPKVDIDNLLTNINSSSTPQEVISFSIGQAKMTFEHLLEESKRSGHVNWGTNVNGKPETVGLDYQNFKIFKSIVQNTGRLFFDLSFQDLINLYPLSVQEQDPFVGSLTNLFAGYILARYKNSTNKMLALDYGEKITYLNPDDFINSNGLPPWVIFNEVLQKANLNFQFDSPSPDASIPLKVSLRHVVSGKEIEFSSLSSGERILITLANFLFFSQDKRQPTVMPDLVLLDEIDAPLHPSMIVDMLRTITEVMVGQYGRKVIMVTHSPSTVALAPEEAVYVMDVSTKSLRKVTRDEGVNTLTVGVPTLSINLENRRQIFVESKHDVELYERITEIAKPYLVSSVSLNFIAAGHEKNGGCALLTSLVEQLNGAGSRTVFGLIDWDGENQSKGNLRILGEGIRHSIENYLLDPVLLGVLLLREKSSIIKTATESGNPILQERENYFHVRDFDDSRLQLLANTVCIALDFLLQEMQTINYVNGRAVQVPKEYLLMRGHDLEARIQTKFPELKRFHQEPKVKKEILHKILEDIPELLPVDFVDLLRVIQNNK